MSPGFVIIVTAILVVIPCALLGSLLVLRQMSMMGDAISHAVLPGIVLAFFITESLGAVVSVIGAGVFGLLTAVLVEALRNTGKVKEDSSIGIVFTALFAFGVFLIARYGGNVHLDLNHVLYGEIAFAPLNSLIIGGVVLGPRSFWTLGLVTVLAIALVGFFYKEFKIATFDPALAAAVGFSPVLIHYLLMGAVSMTVVGAFDAIGAILVVAFLIAPAATAYLLTERLSYMMALAVGTGVVAAVSGYYISFLLDASVSGMMASMTGVLFVAALLFSPSRGLIAAAVRRRRNRIEFTRTLLLARVESLGSGATDGELAHHLGWEEGRVTATLRDAQQEGLILRPGNGEIQLTSKGQGLVQRVAGVST